MTAAGNGSEYRRFVTILPGWKRSLWWSVVPGLALAATPELITQEGANGVTDAADGSIQVVFGPTSQASVGQGLRWLPRALSHEVDHSVRSRVLPADYDSTLLQQIMAEGISSVFDEAAFPGPPNPSDHAISPAQECAMWKRAQPLLGEVGLYNQWFFGGGSVPHWTALTIGYDIVSDYRRYHPGTSWAALTATGSSAILADSHYQPCSH